MLIPDLRIVFISYKISLKNKKLTTHVITPSRYWFFEDLEVYFHCRYYRSFQVEIFALLKIHEFLLASLNADAMGPLLRMFHVCKSSMGQDIIGDCLFMVHSNILEN